MSSTLLPPSPMPTTRRGSLQPHTTTKRLEEQQSRLQQSRGSTGQLWQVIRGNTLLKGAANAFMRQNTWNSTGEELSPAISNASSSSSVKSPLVSNKDQYEFIIPTHTPLRESVCKKNSSTIGQLDLKQYLLTESTGEPGLQTKLGEVEFSACYKAAEEKLKIVLKSIEVFLVPSARVIGSNWVCETTATVDILSCSKKPVELTYGSEVCFHIRKEELELKTLRVSVYDARRKHVNLPIGHVLFPLREVPNIERLNIHSKKLAVYSQPAGFNKGTAQISLVWNPSTHRLDVKIGLCSNLKSPWGVEGKDNYMKLTLFVAGKKERSFKTTALRALPELNFREKFSIAMTSCQLKESWLLFTLFSNKHGAKKMFAKYQLGHVIIGPYMMKSNRTDLSHWENVITSPMEEITDTHTLYL